MSDADELLDAKDTGLHLTVGEFERRRAVACGPDVTEDEFHYAAVLRNVVGIPLTASERAGVAAMSPDESLGWWMAEVANFARQHRKDRTTAH